MNENQYLKEYSTFTKEEINEEIAKQEGIIKEQTAIWEKTGLAGPIVMAVFGLIFSVVLIGIPLAVIGIMKIVEKAKTRNRANLAIYHARDRISVLNSLKGSAKSKSEAIEVEVVK